MVHNRTLQWTDEIYRMHIYEHFNRVHPDNMISISNILRDEWATGWPFQANRSNVWLGYWFLGNGIRTCPRTAQTTCIYSAITFWRFQNLLLKPLYITSVLLMWWTSITAVQAHGEWRYCSTHLFYNFGSWCNSEVSLTPRTFLLRRKSLRYEGKGGWAHS